MTAYECYSVFRFQSILADSSHLLTHTIEQMNNYRSITGLRGVITNLTRNNLFSNTNLSATANYQCHVNKDKSISEGVIEFVSNLDVSKHKILNIRSSLHNSLNQAQVVDMETSEEGQIFFGEVYTKPTVCRTTSDITSTPVAGFQMIGLQRSEDYLKRYLIEFLHEIYPSVVLDFKADVCSSFISSQNIEKARCIHGSHLGNLHVDVCVGSIGCLTDHSDMYTFHLSIDTILSLENQFADKRLVWSPYLTIQPTSPECSNKRCKINIPSLYPPIWIHDLSFWIDTEQPTFQEGAFLELVMNVTQGLVKSVELLDIFCNPHTQRRSHCYRLTYQSCDAVLSEVVANQIQRCLRDCLDKYLPVILR